MTPKQSAIEEAREILKAARKTSDPEDHRNLIREASVLTMMEQAHQLTRIANKLEEQ